MLRQSGSRTKRFNRTDLADIVRGAQVVKKRRQEAIVSLCAKADRALHSYVDRKNEEYAIRMKVPAADQGAPGVGRQDDFVNLAWSHGFQFRSITHIDRQFRAEAKRARQRLRESKDRLKKLRPGHGWYTIKSEIEAGIARERKLLALLPKHIDGLKRAFRKEERRVLRIQNKSGLTIASRKRRRAYNLLVRLTAEIAESRPRTDEGALALIAYVERRSWCDKPEMFADDGVLPGHFGQLLRAALAVLSKGATA